MRIKLNQKYKGLTVEISIKSKKRKSLSNDDIFKQFFILFPLSKILYLSLKKLLSTTSLNDSFNKGINNVSLLLLIVAYLKDLNQRNGSL